MVGVRSWGQKGQVRNWECAFPNIEDESKVNAVVDVKLK